MISAYLRWKRHSVCMIRYFERENEQERACARESHPFYDLASEIPKQHFYHKLLEVSDLVWPSFKGRGFSFLPFEWRSVKGFADTVQNHNS